MADKNTASGFIIAAPTSGSGKTTIALGLAAALRNRGVKVTPAKTGPDYIDTAFLSEAAGFQATNLDPWAMAPEQLRARAASQSSDARAFPVLMESKQRSKSMFCRVSEPDNRGHLSWKRSRLLLVEGVMGLFDGSADGTGSTADLAAILQLPVILVVDVARQSQSVAALVSGFINWRNDVTIAGLILNNVGSARHDLLLRRALEALEIPILGSIPCDAGLKQPQRHLGLLLPDESENFGVFVRRAAKTVSAHCDLEKIRVLAAPVSKEPPPKGLVPLGQHIAIAEDIAFAFFYQHWLNEWKAVGATLSFFSPLADEAVPENADAIFLPGGYPELHAGQLALCEKFFTSLNNARDRGALIYGECGGFMVLGKTLTDKQGNTHKMAGLLPHQTRIDRPRRVLGYRRLTHDSPLPWSTSLTGHEFHYSTGSGHNLLPLFQARDALGEELAPMGAISGRVMGSYAHVIDADGGGRT